MNVIDSPDFLNLPSDVAVHFAAGAKASFFNLPEWYDVVARAGMEPGWKAQLYASGSGALVASVPASGKAGEIRGCSNMYTIEHAVLAGAETIGPFLAQLARENPHTDSMELPGLDLDDARFAGALAGLKEGGFVAKPYFSWGTWFEPVSGCGFDAYLDARPSVLKNTWRRKLAALEKSSRIVFRTTEDLDSQSFIEAYDNVYARSWKEPEPFAGFMPALMRMAAPLGALRYGVLEADGQPIAAQFWIVWRGRAIIYKLAYDEKWGKASPGTLLTMHMIRHVLERDPIDELNFGRGDDDYKKLWMSARRERWGIEAANPKTAQGLARAMRMKAAMARDYLFKRK